MSIARTFTMVRGQRKRSNDCRLRLVFVRYRWLSTHFRTLRVPVNRIFRYRYAYSRRDWLSYHRVRTSWRLTRWETRKQEYKHAQKTLLTTSERRKKPISKYASYVYLSTISIYDIRENSLRLWIVEWNIRWRYTYIFGKRLILIDMNELYLRKSRKRNPSYCYREWNESCWTETSGVVSMPYQRAKRNRWTKRIRGEWKEARNEWKA